MRRAMTEAKKIIYAKRFDGLPKLGDFKLEKEILPALNDGGKKVVQCLVHCTIIAHNINETYFIYTFL